MYIRVNGNSYQRYDLLNDTLQSIYTVNKEEIKAGVMQAYLSNNPGQACYSWPNNIDVSYVMNSNSVKVKLCLSGIHIASDFDCGCWCRFDYTGSISINFTAQILLEGTKYFIKIEYGNAESNMSISGHARDGGPGWLVCEPQCALSAVLSETAINALYSFIGDHYTLFTGTEMKMPLIDLDGYGITDCLTLQEPLISELRAAIPFTLSPSADNGNFVLNVDLMPEGSEPPPVTSPSYDYLGFVCPYYAFQTTLNLPGAGSDYIKQEEILINAMANYKAQSFRFSIPWKEIAVGMNIIDNNTNPDVLNTAALNNEINTLNAFIPSVWANTDTIFSMGFANKLDVIPQLLQEEVDLPRMGNDTTVIAPDDNKAGTTEHDDCAHRCYRYVHANTYLYYVKIYTNAAVQRYKDKVAIWALESELNSARIGALAKWRHGNCWTETNPGGFLERYWRILVDAVKNNDPTAKIATNFHIINLQDGINRFGPDLDIIGVDVYPNIIKTAYPVMGFMVGEVVRATRRVLYNKGWYERSSCNGDELSGNRSRYDVIGWIECA